MPIAHKFITQIQTELVYYLRNCFPRYHVNPNSPRPRHRRTRRANWVSPPNDPNNGPPNDRPIGPPNGPIRLDRFQPPKRPKRPTTTNANPDMYLVTRHPHSACPRKESAVGNHAGIGPSRQLVPDKLPINIEDPKTLNLDLVRLDT